MSYKEFTAEDFADKPPEDILRMVSDNELGLKKKNSELFEQIDKYKGEIGKSSETVEEARAVALKAETEKLEALGKYEEAQKLREQERTELVAKAEENAKKAQDALKQRDLKDVKFSILSEVKAELKAPAEAMLNSITDITYDENGNAVTSIRYADKEFSNTADFLEFAKTDSTWSALLGAPMTKGLDVKKSNAQGGGNISNKPFNQMTMAEKKAYMDSKQ